MRPGVHGHVSPLAAPAQKGVDGIGGVDAVEEGDGHEGRDERDGGGCDQGREGVGGFGLGLVCVSSNLTRGLPLRLYSSRMGKSLDDSQIYPDIKQGMPRSRE